MSTARALNYQTHQIQPQTESLTTKHSSKFTEKRKHSQERERINALIATSLVLCLVSFASLQLFRGVLLNVDRFLTLNTKLDDLKKLETNSEYQNAILKKKYKTYTSSQGLETLARENLNLVGDDEISIILKKS